MRALFARRASAAPSRRPRGLAALALGLGLLAPAARAPRAEDAWPTAMERVEPAAASRAGLVVAAPHAGYDLHTEEIARAAAEHLGCTVAVARNFRKKAARRYVNVNRPSEAEVDAGGEVGRERETERAREVFERWCATVAPDGEAVPLYVEVHGFARSVRRGGESVPLEVVELATVDVDRATARRLVEAWSAEEGLPPLRVDVLDGDYEFRGARERFHHHATQARTRGILREPHVERALHFELPAPLRRDPAGRRAAARGIAAVVEALAPAPARRD